MRKLLLGAAVLVVGAACGKSSAPGYSNSAGSLALSRDELNLYAVDTDNGILAVIDTRSAAKIATVQVGTAPERVVVGADGTIYVSNRGSRSVSVITPGTWQEKARLPVGVEPVGMAVSPNGKTLYVVNATALDTPTQGSVMAIDTASLQLKWEVKVGEEPRGIALVDEHNAVVTLYKQGSLAFLNLDSPSSLASLDPNTSTPVSEQIYNQLNATKLGAGNGQQNGFPTATAFSSFHQRALADIAISPDGKRLFAPAVIAREDRLSSSVNVTVNGYFYGGQGPCAIGSVASTGMLTWDVNGKRPLVDDVTACSFGGASTTADFPPTLVVSPTAGSVTGQTTPITGAYVVAVDPTGTWMFQVNRESNNVALYATSGRQAPGSDGNFSGSSVRALISVGQAPNGIALTSDGTRAYIYNSFDHTISTLVQDNSQSPSTVVELGASSGAPQRITVASDPAGMSAQVLAGRRLFFDATDARMNNLSVGVTCNTCHSEGGRDDGHTWAFPDGLRNTPSLAGRMILETPPYHWSGEFPDLPSFMDLTVHSRMGGSGLGPTEQAAITAYIGSLGALDNPLHLATPTAQQTRGAAVFASAQCATCHTGQALTNNGFASVGTLNLNADDPLKDTLFNTQGLNVPSLLGLARTAPYLHDGKALTLQDRINANRTSPDASVRNQHGNLDGVTDSQVDDLVAYLQSL